MHAVEDLGLLKIDLLGLKNLTIIENTLRLIKELKDITIDISKIPLDDKKILSKIIPFKHDLIMNSNILSASAVSDLPGAMIWVTSIDYDGSNKQNTTMSFLEIDKDFIKTFGVHLRE